MCLVEGALELIIMSIISDERTEHINALLSGVTPIAYINPAEDAKSCPEQSADCPCGEPPREGRLAG